MIEALIFIACILGALIFVGGFLFGPEVFESISEKRAHNKEVEAGTFGMSLTSKAILHKYNSLPADNRPFGDIIPVLRALDTAHEVSKVDYHFSARRYTFEVSCYCHMDSMGCEYKDYREIANTIKSIQIAIAAREKAIAMANVAHELELVDALKDSLREEENAILSVTKELS